MKPSGEQEALAIQGNNKKWNMKIFILILLASLISFEGFAQNKRDKSKEQPADANKKEEQAQVASKNKMDFEFFYIEGLKEKMVGNPDRALQYFNQCLEIDPRSAASMYEMANIYLMKGEMASSQLLLEKAIQINPENKWYKIRLVQIYQNNNDLEKAINIYNSLIESEPDNADFYFMNALLFTKLGNYDDAIKTYNDLEKISGYNEQIAMSRQTLYQSMGKKKDAYAEIQRLIDTFPNNPTYYGVMADAYKENGEMKKALEYYNMVIEKDPSNGFVHFSLFLYYVQNEDFEKAFEHGEIAFADPNLEIEDKYEIYRMLMETSDSLKIRDDQMEKLVESMEKAHPLDNRVYSIHADFLYSKGKGDAARKYAEKSLEINPNSYSIWQQLLMIDSELNDFESMLKHSRKAIELFPTQPFLYILNVAALLQYKKYDEALKVLAEGISYVADNKLIEAQFLMYEGEAYYYLDRFDDACKSFDKSISLDPSNYMAMNNYAYYLSEKNLQLEKAEKMSGTVIQANSDNATYLDTHAWVLFRKKEYRLAKFYIENALRNGGDESSVIIEHYGDILYFLDEKDKALDQWKKALEKDDSSETLKNKIQQKRYIEEVK